MVLFKRKVVSIPTPKYTPEHADQEVWFIPETLEYFCSYDEYLKRMDFYTMKKFICELSGASCLTYFDARQREIKETENVLKKFPEPLKRPILEKVHMSTITRLDQLVDELYAWLRDRFFVGEIVYVRYQDQRIGAEVIKAENGIYQVDDGERVLEGDFSQLARDRKIVSKLTLRAFVKHSATREQWVGAPWEVREDYRAKYDISSEVPPEVQQLYAQRAEEVAQAQIGAINGSNGGQASSGLDGVRSGANGKPSGNNGGIFGKFTLGDDSDPANGDDMDVDEIGNSISPRPSTARATSQRMSRRKIVKLLESLPETHHYHGDDLFQLARQATDEPLREFVNARVQSNPWPIWHEDERLVHLQSAGKVAHLIEIWLFSHIFKDLLGMSDADMLTFDDFVDAMSSREVPQPIVKLHENVLNMFVNKGKSELAIPMPAQADAEAPKRRKKSGRPRKRTKTSNDHYSDDEYGDDDDDEFGDDNDDNDENEEEDGHADSDANSEAGNREGDDTANGGDHDDEEDERSEELEEDSWVKQIGARQYADGGWQYILAHVLSDLCYLREWHPDTQLVVDRLLPSGQVHTASSVANAFADLSLTHRTHALMMIIRVLYGSKPLREYLDAQYEQLTKLKKKPLNKELKQLAEDLRAVERVISLAKERSASPVVGDERTSSGAKTGTEQAQPETTSERNGNSQKSNKEDVDYDRGQVDETKDGNNGTVPDKNSAGEQSEKADEESHGGESGQRADDNADGSETLKSSDKHSTFKQPNSGKQQDAGKKDMKAKEGEVAPDLDTLLETQQRLKEEHEAKSLEANEVGRQIARLDNQRMRLLGKDRFFNRYWWMDGNGLSSATGNDTFAMGKLCIQGPSAEDLVQCLNSTSYSDEFVQFRKTMFTESQNFREQRKNQLRVRREAKAEAERRSLSVLSASSSKSPQAADKSAQYSNGETELELAEHRLNELVEINRVMNGLTEAEAAELRTLKEDIRRLSEQNVLPMKQSAGTSSISEVSSVGLGISTKELPLKKPRKDGRLDKDFKFKNWGSKEVPKSSNSMPRILPKAAKIEPKWEEASRDQATSGPQSVQGRQVASSEHSASTGGNNINSSGSSGDSAGNTNKQVDEEKQLRLKQAQEQVQMQAQIAARVQAHFDAEVQAQANARYQSQAQAQASPQAGAPAYAQPPPQEAGSIHPPQAAQPQPPQIVQPPYQPGSQVPMQQMVPPPPPPPPLGTPQGAYPQAPHTRPPHVEPQMHPPPPQPYGDQMYPQQEPYQWVVQQTIYGPMLYALPVHQYQMLVQQYGAGVPQSGVQPGAAGGDAYQAYLQQVAAQQAYAAHGYAMPPGYLQAPYYGQVPPPQIGEQPSVPQQIAAPQAPGIAPPPVANSATQSPKVVSGAGPVAVPTPAPSTAPVPVSEPAAAADPAPVAQQITSRQVSPAPETKDQASTTANSSDRPDPIQSAKPPAEKRSYLAHVMNPVSEEESSSEPRKESTAASSAASAKEGPKETGDSQTEQQTVQPTEGSHAGATAPSEALPQAMDVDSQSHNRQKSAIPETKVELVESGESEEADVQNTEQPKPIKMEIDAAKPTAPPVEPENSSAVVPEQKSSVDETVQHEEVLTPLDLLKIFKQDKGLLSSNEWRFYEKPEEVDQLITYLFDFGERESSLLDALRKAEATIKNSMLLRLQALDNKDKAEEADN